MIRYRDADAADAATLADLFERCFVETFGHLYSDEDLASFLGGADERAWAGELADPGLSIRLAESDGVAIAFAKVGTLALPVQPEGPSTELRQLYVLKPWQGSGIAQSLMEWILSQARERGAETIYLSVWSHNWRAKAFYGRYGFAYVAPYAFMVGNQADKDEIWRLTLT